MTYEFVTSLGWNYCGLCNNREFFTLGKRMILEHQGSWYICNKTDLYSREINGECVLREYTQLINNILQCENNPSNYTLEQYLNAKKNLRKFLIKLKK